MNGMKEKLVCLWTCGQTCRSPGQNRAVALAHRLITTLTLRAYGGAGQFKSALRCFSGMGFMCGTNHGKYDRCAADRGRDGCSGLLPPWSPSLPVMPTLPPLVWNGKRR